MLTRTHLVFELTGSCKGAYRFKEYVEDNGEISVYQIQPKNQVVELYSDTTTNPSNSPGCGQRIFPRWTCVEFWEWPVYHECRYRDGYT